MPVQSQMRPPAPPQQRNMQQMQALAKSKMAAGANSAGPAIAGVSRTLGFKKGGVVPPFPKPAKAGTKVAGKKTVVKTGKGGKPNPFAKGKAKPFAKANPFAKAKGKGKANPFAKK